MRSTLLHVFDSTNFMALDGLIFIKIKSRKTCKMELGFFFYIPIWLKMSTEFITDVKPLLVVFPLRHLLALFLVLLLVFWMAFCVCCQLFRASSDFPYNCGIVKCIDGSPVEMDGWLCTRITLGFVSRVLLFHSFICDMTDLYEPSQIMCGERQMAMLRNEGVTESDWIIIILKGNKDNVSVCME